MVLDLPAIVAAGALNLVASLYVGYRNRCLRKADAERSQVAAGELEWKKKTDRQLEELRGIIRRLEYPIKARLGVDIRLDR